MLSANVINKVVGMLSTMLLTRLLSQGDYGIWSYALNVYSYMLMITGFGLNSSALLFGTENKGVGKAYSIFKYCLTRGFLINVALVIAVGLPFCFVDIPIEDARLFVILVLPTLLFEIVISTAFSILRSQNRIKQFARTLNVNTVSNALFTCAGAYWGLFGVVIGRYMANIATVIISVKILYQDSKEIKAAPVLEKTEVKRIWQYAVYTGISTALNTLVFSLDISAVAVLLKSETMVSLYRVGTLIPTALFFIPNSIIVAILPNIIANRGNIDWIKSRLKKAFLYLGLFNLGITAVAVLLAPYVITLISGAKYSGSVPVFQILMVGYFFAGTFRSMSVSFLSAFRRVKYGLFVSIVSCIFDVVLNYFFVIRMGYVGAAYATLVVDIITAILAFSYLVYLIKINKINEIT